MENSSIDNDLERRLNNWARWSLESGPHRSAGVSSVYRQGPRPMRAGAGMPLMNGEAVETDGAISRLRESHRDALRAYYLRISPAGAWLGAASDARVAQALGCSRSTLAERLTAARRQLAAELAERHRAAARQRDAWHAARA